MTKKAQSRGILRMLSLVGGLALPTLTLIPLGSFWLWQQGLLLYWASAATILVLIAYGVQRWVFPENTAPTLAEPSVTDPTESVSETWTPVEAKAWDDVLAVMRRTDPARIGGREEALALAFETIEVVARRIHPEVAEPLWQFTVPEAFAMLERVSTRLGTFTHDHVPLSDRLTVGQALALYRWRGTIEGIEKAYDFWRLVRMANPLTAVTGELRDRLSKQMVQWGRQHLQRQLAETYVKEVGRAAIDLYGGRLSVGRDELRAHVSGASRADLEAAGSVAEPLRIMVAGQVSAGKSSVINALGGEIRAAVDVLPTTSRFVPYALTRSGLPAALLIDSPGLEPDLGRIDDLVQRAMACDLVLWVAVANTADRALDLRAIKAFRTKFAAERNRRPPPLLLVLTNIDRLRPFQDWSPPYDLADATSPKAQSIASAIAAASADLDVSSGDIVAVCLNPDTPAYNIDELWHRIAGSLSDAKKAQLLRQIQDLKSDRTWSRLWSQTVNAGRVLGQTLYR